MFTNSITDIEMENSENIPQKVVGVAGGFPGVATP